MDGEDFELNDLPFDAVISRVGLIYFPDQLGAIKRQAAALRVRGYLGAIVYATPEECSRTLLVSSGAVPPIVLRGSAGPLLAA